MIDVKRDVSDVLLDNATSASRIADLNIYPSIYFSRVLLDWQGETGCV